MIYFILFVTAAFLTGFISGAAIKSFLDKDEVLDLEKQNARLHAQIEKMRHETVNVDTVEIIDPTVGRSVDFSQRW